MIDAFSFFIRSPVADGSLENISRGKQSRRCLNCSPRDIHRSILSVTGRIPFTNKIRLFSLPHIFVR